MAAQPKPGVGPNPQPIFEAANGYQNSFLLKAGIDLELFTVIAKGSHSVPEIARATDASERGIRILCDALTILGFLTKAGESYSLTLDSATFLDSRSPAYLGKAFTFLLHSSHVENMVNFASTVRRGGAADNHHLAPDDEIWVDFARGMVPLIMPAAQTIAGYLKAALTGRNSPLARRVKAFLVEQLGEERAEKASQTSFLHALTTLNDGAELATVFEEAFKVMASDDDLERLRAIRVLDIAAGHGVFGIAVAQQIPSAQIYAVDWPNVLTVAGENAHHSGVSARHYQIKGNAFDVDYGTGYDAVLLTNFLHHFNPATNEVLLRRLYQTLNPGGQLVILEFVPNPDRVTPPIAAMFSVNMLAGTPDGDAFTFAELAAMCANAGFKGARQIPVEATPQSLVVAEKA
jgi:2-polyprenyl-3-methyl-5-hydroxy-6-metoxy-1,4-benzoquinol methylase